MKLVDSTPCAFLVCMSISEIFLTWSIESTTVTWINKYAGHNSKDLILLHNPVLKCCKMKSIECSHMYLKCLIYSVALPSPQWLNLSSALATLSGSGVCPAAVFYFQLLGFLFAASSVSIFSDSLFFFFSSLFSVFSGFCFLASQYPSNPFRKWHLWRQQESWHY